MTRRDKADRRPAECQRPASQSRTWNFITGETSQLTGQLFQPTFHVLCNSTWSNFVSRHPRRNGPLTEGQGKKRERLDEPAFRLFKIIFILLLFYYSIITLLFYYSIITLLFSYYFIILFIYLFKTFRLLPPLFSHLRWQLIADRNERPINNSSLSL